MNESDGRYIDPRVGLLEAEGSLQKSERREGRLERVARDAWIRKETSTPPLAESSVTYYDRPTIKEPVWKWYIPAYFYTGGAAGAAAALGAAAQALDSESLRGLIRKCRWIAAGGTGIGTVLLILDLGRPARFMNMLRVFRPTSPLNVGSWILTPAATFSHGAAVLSRSTGVLGAVGDAAGYGAGVFGVPLAGYTAVLLSYSAVPIWQSISRTLPSLFVSSAVVSAASLLEMTSLNDDERRVVSRFGTTGRIAELVAASAVEREAARVERVAMPLKDGVSGTLWKMAKFATAGSLLVSLVSGRRRGLRRLAAVLGTLGSISMRFALFRAGFASARDPRATFDMQRAGLGGREVMDEAAVTGPSARAVER